jgi:hypothetical protein
MRGHVPYRGDGQPRYSKPRRRFVNLKEERWETALSILFFIVFVSCGLGSAIFSTSPGENNTTDIAALVIGAILILTFIVGMLSLNKFRKGYDVDISERAQKDDDNNHDELEKTLDS